MDGALVGLTCAEGRVGDVQVFELDELEACVEVDVFADGEDGDAPVGDAEAGYVWARHCWRLDLGNVIMGELRTLGSL